MRLVVPFTELHDRTSWSLAEYADDYDIDFRELPVDDDNAYLPCHVSALVSALEETGADFAYSRWLHAGTDGLTGGQAPPGRTRTDSSAIMHRATTLKHGSWWMDGYEADGVLAERWLAAGCSWAFVDEPTLILYPHRCGAPDDLEG